MASTLPQDSYMGMEAFWSLPPSQIRHAISALFHGDRQDLLAVLLIHGIFRKHPIAQSWAERGGRKIAGLAMDTLLARDPRARERLNSVVDQARLETADASTETIETPE